MVSLQQLAIASATLRWNILEMIALEEELDSKELCSEARERVVRRLEHLKQESPGLAADLQASLIARREDAAMSSR